MNTPIHYHNIDFIDPPQRQQRYARNYIYQCHTPQMVLAQSFMHKWVMVGKADVTHSYSPPQPETQVIPVIQSIEAGKALTFMISGYIGKLVEYSRFQSPLTHIDLKIFKYSFLAHYNSNSVVRHSNIKILKSISIIPTLSMYIQGVKQTTFSLMIILQVTLYLKFNQGDITDAFFCSDLRDGQNVPI